VTTYNTPASIYGPVTDWATDFDHGDPEYNRRAHEIWAESRTTPSTSRAATWSSAS